MQLCGNRPLDCRIVQRLIRITQVIHFNSFVIHVYASFMQITHVTLSNPFVTPAYVTLIKPFVTHASYANYTFYAY